MLPKVAVSTYYSSQSVRTCLLKAHFAKWTSRGTSCIITLTTIWLVLFQETAFFFFTLTELQTKKKKTVSVSMYLELSSHYCDSKNVICILSSASGGRGKIQVDTNGHSPGLMWDTYSVASRRWQCLSRRFNECMAQNHPLHKPLYCQVKPTRALKQIC